MTPLTTPFLYDPAAGNLVLDLQVSSDTGLPIQYIRPLKILRSVVLPILDPLSGTLASSQIPM